MTHLIEKDALVAEIERRKNICQGGAEANKNNEFAHLYYSGKTEAYSEMSELLDTFEVKEVDLDLEITLWANAIPEIRLDDVERLAKHFFELGLKTQKVL